MSLQLANQLMSSSVVDAASSVSRGRQQVLTSEIKADVKNFIFMARQCAKTAALSHTYNKTPFSEYINTLQ